MVAPGIAVAAAHVIELSMPDVMASRINILCIGYTPTGFRFWRVKHIQKVDNTDLMILSLQFASPLPQDGRFVQTALTTRLPGIGEQVMIVGLRASSQHVAADEDMCVPVRDRQIKYGADVLIGVGEVMQHHLNGRGSMVPGPAIEVACSTAGGLSGGPAFDQFGKVFGILSVSLNYADGRGPSQVSMVWPALVLPLTPFFLPHIFPTDTRLLDLSHDVCGIDRRDAIRWSRDPKPGSLALNGTITHRAPVRVARMKSIAPISPAFP